MGVRVGAGRAGMIVAAAVIVPVVGVLVVRGFGPQSGGPFELRERSEWCIPAAPAGVVTFGSTALVNEASTPIVIEAVTVGPTTGPATLANIVVAPIHNTTLVGSGPGWDPPADAVSAEGWVVEPGEAVNLVARIEVAPGQDAIIEGLVVTYHHDGRTYRDAQPSFLRVATGGC